MNVLARRISCLTSALPLLVGFVPAPRAQEPEAVLLHDESDGLVAVESFGAIRIAGLEGSVLVRSGKEGELRYAARARKDRQETRPVGLWMRAGELELSRLPGSAVEPLWIEMAVPPGLEVELDIDASSIEIAGLRSGLIVRGTQLDVDARGIYGDVVVDAADSKMRIDGVDGQVDIDGEVLQLSVGNVSSYVTLVLTDSEAGANEVRGAADFELQGSTLIGQGFEQGVRVSAAEGSVELRNVRREADLRLARAPLLLSESQGRYTIESDADVRIDSVQGFLTVSGYGARVHASNNNGPLDISSSQGPVVVEKHNGKVHIEGDGLTVEVREQRGEVSIATTGSDVQIEKADGSVDVTNDFGDVRVDATTQAVRIANLNGNVFASEIAGPLEVRGSGERVEIAWTSVAADGVQSISNEQGQVVARLPPNSRCRIEVESSYGTVRSELPTVRVSEDRRFASGVLGSAQKPVIEIQSAGDVLVTGAGGGAAAPTQ